uniref:Uncharacterized protein n=1 Tax=Siphoviridae sp. ct4T77 TaxID=2823563 RepID=A0A8S5L8W5_9CAUD|nr:MAG TPA: hypothetical protein [Siphoviridae sp. ct4T77]DAN51546.1 MAG TPA: hypothetical protein [Caudoviricetes sp.]DAQ35463.1 MAG TPA: hypothetical protein [Caudoviricetes sp.]
MPTARSQGVTSRSSTTNSRSKIQGVKGRNRLTKSPFA